MCPPASSPSRDLLGELLGGLHCQDGLVADAITAAVGQLLDYIKQNGVAGAVRLAERGARLITGLNAAQASIDAVDKCSDLNDAGAHNSCIAGYISFHTVGPSSDLHSSTLARRFERLVMPQFTSGRLRPVIDQVFNFNQIAETHRHMESDKSFGKIIVRV